MPIDKAALTSCKPAHLRWQLALRCAVITCMAGTLVSIALLAALTFYQQDQAQSGQHAIARSIAQTLSQQTARAVRLGIPLPKLPGAEEYLKQTMDSTPQLAYLAISDAHGKPLYSVSRSAAGSLLTQPVIVKGQTVAQVQAGARTSQVQALLQPALSCLLLVLAVAVICGAVVYLLPARSLQKKHDLLHTALCENQQLSAPEVEHRNALDEAIQSLARLQQRNQQAQQSLRDYAAELRAVDFDQKMLPVIDLIESTAIKRGALR